MIYVHENNIKNKIKGNYNKKGEKIEEFYNEKYLPMKSEVEKINFTKNNKRIFEYATNIFNKYYNELEEFSKMNGIKSQSKFTSTFLEEISVYLFKDLPSIRNGFFNIYNKGIYAGMKIGPGGDIDFIKKDVDFCIGKKVSVSIDEANPESIILPAICVEVKTYLDATMFGEIKSSSKALRSATPSSSAYVLMGYKDLADEHIIAARQDSTLNEMFVLKKNKNSEMESVAIYEYWKEIAEAVEKATKQESVSDSGRLLREK